MSTRILTQALAKECFDYSPETGALRWKVRPLEHFPNESKWKMCNTLRAGKDAGTIMSDGYIAVTTFGKASKAHRVIWLIVHGEFPKDLDHINGIRTDNRLCNLREVDKQTNSRNVAISTRNTSGIIGICFSRSERKWRAYIHGDKGQIHLGWFTDKSGAIAARKAAEIEFGYHQNHGRQKPIPVRD